MKESIKKRVDSLINGNGEDKILPLDALMYEYKDGYFVRDNIRLSKGEFMRKCGKQTRELIDMVEGKE